MQNTGYPLDAYVIVDNNAIASISECCCSTYQAKDFCDAVPLACKDIGEIFTSIRRFALGQKVFTTPCIRDEFKPEKGDLSKHQGFQLCHCENLKAHVLSQVEVLDVNMKAIDRIRGMSQTPKGWGQNLSGISDPDLSLFLLALGMVNKLDQRVYILTDEEKLRGFTSWGKTRPEVKEICAHSEKVEALHSLVYLDSVHRKCAISTDQIFQMFGFRTNQQMARTFLGGTTMGEMITETYRGIYQMIIASSNIKRDMAGAAL